MTELESLVQLLIGLTAVCAAGGLVATCLRFRSPMELLLATYVLSSAFVVAQSLLLSPGKNLDHRSALAGSLAILGAAVLAWLVAGRPLPPSPRPAFDAVRGVLRDRLLGALALVVAVAFAYSLALAFLTPINDGDALAYHLARAAFWQQAGGIGYIDGAIDSRLNGNPPNAEIGMLFTMLLAGSDRFVAIPQIAAYVALVACVIGLARQTGRDAGEAMFGGLLFGSLPVVILQASTALNDLVVAAFLATATYFGLRPGRSALVVFALALGLALGTKLTALIAIPIVLAAICVGRARKDWLSIGGAALVGMALGSLWYVVNQLESGRSRRGPRRGLRAARRAVARGARRHVRASPTRHHRSVRHTWVVPPHICRRCRNSDRARLPARRSNCGRVSCSLPEGCWRLHRCSFAQFSGRSRTWCSVGGLLWEGRQRPSSSSVGTSMSWPIPRSRGSGPSAFCSSPER